MSATICSNGMAVLKKRYLNNGESVEGMFRRVAGGNKDYYNLMADLRFLPNSPTLFNAGLNNGCTLSACFVFNVADQMLGSSDSIVGTREKAAAVAKAGGGVGYYFGNLRPKGSPIRSVHRVACGPVTVLRDYHAVSNLITQGGKRELAQMGVLPCHHNDIREFIHCKDEDPQGLGSFNISVSWTDEWLHTAFEKPVEKRGLCLQLWDEQCQSAWKTGCPGMLFRDTVNRNNPNPHLGDIEATNPCGETPNRGDEPCNLGSLNLVKYWLQGQRGPDAINWERLAEDSRLATRFLDDILDRNTFPHPDITKAALLTRKLGLGVMGWADLLALCHIHYDTDEAVTLGERLMEFINEQAFAASYDLAAGNGPYDGFDDGKTTGDRSYARNETRTSIAPTGTISLIAGCSPSIEPHFALENERTTSEGMKLKECINVWEDLDGFIPKVASEIAPEWHVRHQAAFQKHTDLGVSKTVNLPNSATVEDVSRIYRLMWESGCKGGTVFRDGCRAEQVLVKTNTKSVYLTSTQPAAAPQRRRLPRVRPGNTVKVEIGGTFEGYLRVSVYPEDGSPGEVFFEVSKDGSTVQGLLNAWCIALSLDLQHGVPLETLVRKYKGMRFEPCGLTNDPDIRLCTSVVDFVAQYLERHYLKGKELPSNSNGSGKDSGLYCPDCGRELIYQSGCLSCPGQGCGWSRCG